MLNNPTDLRSADEWLTDSEFDWVAIIEPDGWDQRDFHTSWCERISRSEFETRMLRSTIISKRSLMRKERGENSAKENHQERSNCPANLTE